MLAYLADAKVYICGNILSCSCCIEIWFRVQIFNTWTELNIITPSTKYQQVSFRYRSRTRTPKHCFPISCFYPCRHSFYSHLLLDPRWLSYLRLSHLFLDAPVWKSRSTNSSLADNGGCPGFLVRVNVLFYSKDFLSDIPLKSCHPLSFPFSAQNKLTSKLGYAQYSIIK